MVKDWAFERIPPEFTLRQLCWWLGINGCVLTLSIGFFFPKFPLAVALVLVCIGRLKLVLDPRRLPDAIIDILPDVCAIGSWIGWALLEPIFYFFRMYHYGPQPPQPVGSSPKYDLTIEQLCAILLAFKTLGTLLFCYYMCNSRIKRAIASLPQGWDTPVRHFFS